MLFIFIIQLVKIEIFKINLIMLNLTNFIKIDFHGRIYDFLKFILLLFATCTVLSLLVPNF